MIQFFKIAIDNFFYKHSLYISIYLFEFIDFLKSFLEYLATVDQKVDVLQINYSICAPIKVFTTQRDYEDASVPLL